MESDSPKPPLEPPGKIKSVRKYSWVFRAKPGGSGLRIKFGRDSAIVHDAGASLGDSCADIALGARRSNRAHHPLHLWLPTPPGRLAKK